MEAACDASAVSVSVAAPLGWPQGAQSVFVLMMAFVLASLAVLIFKEGMILSSKQASSGFVSRRRAAMEADGRCDGGLKRPSALEAALQSFLDNPMVYSEAKSLLHTALSK
mmetsp:Transcript_31891/g.95236  ORF Transcript_31891/g.95236 Transcript_31891/m.95236 type:complete len:111 (-) Transcript_31891:3817-4149(-)